jgi:hypothetical protein
MIQKFMKLCECPPDVCRADAAPENCRFVMDPHNKMENLNKAPEIAKTETPTPFTNLLMEKVCWNQNTGYATTYGSVTPATVQEFCRNLEKELYQARKELEKHRKPSSLGEAVALARGGDLAQVIIERDEARRDRDALVAALQYWMPDETLVEKRHEDVWYGHIALVQKVESTKPNPGEAT